jgi:DNA repair exonuclease SbcCD ATPase subunit
MKLNRLKLIDWRNIVEAELELKRLVVIRGANKQGKSSIQQGIEYAITGRCDGLDAKGTAAERLIRQGADKAGIGIRLQANKEVQLRCTLTEKSGRDVKFKDDSDPTYTGDVVRQWLESQKPVLSCLLNGRYFIGLKPAEQKTLLSSIILPDTYEWPEAIKSKCSAVHISASIPWDKSPFEIIEAAYKLAFEKRTDVNRDLKNLHIPDAIAAPEGLGDMAAVREKLTQLRGDLTKLSEGRYAQQKAHSKAESDIRVLETRIESLTAKIRMEQSALSTTDISILSGKALKDAQTTAGNEKRLGKMEKELEAVRAEIAGVKAILKTFDSLDGKRACPTCKRDVTDEWLLSAMEPHVTRNNNLMVSENNIMREQGGLGDVAAAKRKLEDHERALASQKRSQAILAETESLLKTAREELDALNAAMPPKPSEGDDPQSIVMREEMRNLESKLEAVAVAEARAKEIERANEQHKKLAQASGVLDSLVTYFGKDGVKAELLKEHIGGFTSAMNEALASWGYACSFEIEPYGFRVTNMAKNTTHAIELLSGSEKLRFSVAFQVALAQVSGIRMVVVDECDVLDSEGRGALYPMLLSADIDQAIVIGTNESREVPDVDGAIFYMMVDGKAELLVPAEVAA